MAVPLFYTSFQAGLDTKRAPYLLDEGLGPLPSRDLMNVQSTVAGAIVKRNGLSTFATPAGALTSLFALESVSPTLLIGATGTTIVSISTGGTVSSIKTGLTSNLRWEFVSGPVVSGQGPLYGLNGTDTPLQGNAAGALGAWTNASGAVAVPNGKYMTYARNQAYVAGTSSNPSRVYISAINDPTNWDINSATGANQIDFDPNDGQVITGLGRVGPYVLVAKPRKLWVISDPGSLSTAAVVRQISDQIGCVAHRSIVSSSDGTYFLSEDKGVYLTNGTKLEPISDIIQPTIDLVDGQKQNAAATYFNGHLYLSVAGAGTGANDTTLDWDTTLKSWWRHSFGSNQFAVWHPTSSAQLYSAKATAAVLDQCFVAGVNQDNGTNFKWYWRGPWQSPSFYRRRLFPTPYYRKRLRQVRCDGSGTVDYSLAKDFASVETLIRANVFGTAVGGTYGASDGTTYGASDGSIYGSPSVQRARFYTLGVANAFSMVFSATSNTADTVDSYLMVLHDRVDLVTR